MFCFPSLSPQAKDIYGRNAVDKQWMKLDHSQFVWRGPPAASGTWAMGQGAFKVTNPRYHNWEGCALYRNDDGAGVSDVQGMIDRCGKSGNCDAFHCVPLHPPAHVMHRRLNAPFVWGHPSGSNGCVASKVGPQVVDATTNPMLCYGFRLPLESPEVGEQWAISDDPSDRCVPYLNHI